MYGEGIWKYFEGFLELFWSYFEGTLLMLMVSSGVSEAKQTKKKSLAWLQK